MDLLKQIKAKVGKPAPAASSAPAAEGAPAAEPGPAAASDAATTPTPAAPAGQSTGEQDALDKGVDAVLNKAGRRQSTATTEKISDGVRSLFKKATGKDVPVADKS